MLALLAAAGAGLAALALGPSQPRHSGPSVIHQHHVAGHLVKLNSGIRQVLCSEYCQKDYNNLQLIFGGKVSEALFDVNQ